VTYSELPGDASRRRYTRLSSGGETRILLEGPDPGENAAWLHMGRELRNGGFPLPEIHAWDLGAGLFLMEDLGDTHLADLEGGGEAGEFASACREAAAVLAGLHDRGWGCLRPVMRLVAPPYDAEFVWASEWSYFLEGAGLLGLNVPSGGALAGEGRKIAALAGCERERSFIHRDFQSRNVLVKDGRPRFIDWQGGRLGPPYYDLASLLYDPYTDLSPGERREIGAAYLAARETPAGADEYADRTRFFGIVRLMQAAGAYAHLAAARGKPAFARYLPRALARVRELLGDLPGGAFPGLSAFLDDYLARLPQVLDGMGICAL
jgi:aminoglycoside/choline kinase family phosphotransferase